MATPFPYNKEELDAAREIHDIRTKKITSDKKIKFTSGIFSAYVHISRDGEYAACGEFVNMKTKMLFKHNKCGHEYYVLPERVYYHNATCPKCARKNRINNLVSMNKERYESKSPKYVSNNESLEDKINTYLDTLPVKDREINEKLIGALNNTKFIYGIYSNKIKHLLLYKLNYITKEIERFTYYGNLDDEVIKMTKVNATVTRRLHQHDQYEFYNPKTILLLVDDSLGFCHPIFNDASNTVYFINGDIPENVLDIDTTDKISLNYKLVYNLLTFALDKKILRAGETNNVVAKYIEDGYSSIVKLVPYVEYTN